MPNKLTTEEFIKRARAIHGDTFDYSLVKYNLITQPVVIICKNHGPFQQLPVVHLQGHKCPACAGVPRHDTQSFINKAIDIHGTRYDYSLTEYNGSHKKIKIICKLHGEFEQLATNHLRGKGCDKCAREESWSDRKVTIDDFIERSRRSHGDKYSYHLVSFDKTTDKVLIICPVHGEFSTTANSHMLGSGCSKCGHAKRAADRVIPIDEFKDKCSNIHNGKYDYSLVEYLRLTDKVKIICPTHGEFEQVAQYHISGRGCEKCGRQAVGDINGRNSMGWRATEWEQAGINSSYFDGFKLYLVLIKGPENGEYFLKVGRTFRRIDKRFKDIKLQFKVIYTYTSSALDVFKAEASIKKAFKDQRVIPSIKFGGMHECFSIAALDSLMTEFEKLNGHV